MSSWTVRRIVKRAIEVLREESVKSLWFKILGETVYRRVVVLERRLEDPINLVEPRLPVEIGLLRQDEVDAYLTFNPAVTLEEIHWRKEHGHQCYVVHDKGQIVHACWLAINKVRIDYLDRDFTLAPDEAYTYESFTVPAYRGQNLAPARLTYVQRLLREAGYRRMLAVVMPENRVAFRPIEKAGYRRVGKVGYLKLGPWRHDFGCLSRFDLGATQWDTAAEEMDASPHYLDPFLGALKRRIHLDLIERWGGADRQGVTLKTDLFEEGMGPDAYLTDLSGRHVVGMDISPVIAGRAQRRDTEQCARYVAADVRQLPFADDTFTFIVSPSTLDHFTDPADLGRSLGELARVLHPEGWMLVTLDNRQNLFDPLLRLVIRLGWIPYYIGSAYTVDEMRSELQAVGLRVTDTTAILHNPRLVATGMVMVANRLRWQPLIRLVHWALTSAQRLEGTRWQYRTGCFLAARAVKPQT